MVLVSSSGDGKKDDGSVVDYRGGTVDKSRTGGWLAAGLILGIELSERVCVMGISMNLVTYLVGDLHIPAAKSANIVTNFMGTLNLLGLLCGFLADAKLGRYLTVAISASITALGLVLLTLATSIPSLRPPQCDSFRSENNQCIEASGKQLVLLYAALYTTALGGGGIKSNVSGFGSDQFDINDPKEEKSMIFFFNRFYFGISIGSLFAVIVLVYVQDNVGRGWGYGISGATMVIAIIVLLCGTRKYRFRMPQGSPLTVLWRVIILALKKRSHPHPPHPSLLNDYENRSLPYTERLKCLDKAAIVDGNASAPGNRSTSAWLVSTVTEVEEVKLVLKLIPIWSTCILFWTVYSQMTTFTIEQATFMNRKVGSFTVPSGSFSAFLFITILLFTSLNEKVFIPLARSINHTAHGITSLQRIGLGLIFSILAMAASAIIEKERRNMAVQRNEQMSAFCIIPQYFLVGAGEAFVYVGQLEFFIREAPERMKSMSTGLFLSAISMGFFVSSFLVFIVHSVTKDKWLANNLNTGGLDYFYWFLAMLGVLNLSVFIFFASRHQYKAHLTIYSVESGEKELKSLYDETGDDIEKKAITVSEGKQEA